MLYNKKLKRVRNRCDCVDCEYFDKRLKDCKGIGKDCFPYDEKTKTCIDPVTHLPINFNGEV